MRVTHVITRLIVGGAQENTVASVLGLEQRRPDWRVELISGPPAGPEGSLESSFTNRPDHLTLLPSLIRPLHPWRDTVAWRQLTRLFRERAPEIVHTHSGKAGFLGRLAARRAGVPVIVHTIHGPSFGPFQGALPNLLFTTAERVAGRLTTHFVTVADAMRRQYLAARIGRPEQYTRIFSGFELAPFQSLQPDPAVRARWGIGAEDMVVGKIARLFKLKGHHDLLAAAPRLVQRCPRMKFLLVGDGAWRARLEQEAARRGVRSHFVFTGLVPPAAVPELVGAMDIVVHLSRREGLPRALPQALAAARPVVAYDCDGAREVCRDGQTGFLIPPGDTERLAERVLELSASPQLRAQFGQTGRRWVSANFSVEKMVTDLESLYVRLTGGGSSSPNQTQKP